MKKPKMVIVVRTDLPMGVGKAIAQAGHAVAQLMLGTRNEHFPAWVASGMKKVTLQVGSEAELLQVAGKAAEKGLSYTVVKDAGLTQLPPGTPTVVAVGPAKDKQIEKVTGSLKLYD